MTLVLDLASWTLLAAGGLFCVVGAVGLIRMPDFYTRVHAASVTDTLGVGFLIFGMGLQAGFSLVLLKLLFLLLLFVFGHLVMVVKSGFKRQIRAMTLGD